MNDRVFRASQAHKLDDPERKNWLPPGSVLDALGLRPEMTVADIGAGTGYFSIPIADAPHGVSRVYAVDLQPEMLQLLKAKLSPEQADKVVLLQGRADAVPLEGSSCDLVLLANIWHEIDSRVAVLSECRRVLREKGRIAILDWRPDVDQPPGPPLAYRLSQETVISELSTDGWVVLLEQTIGLYSYLILAEVAAS